MNIFYIILLISFSFIVFSFCTIVYFINHLSKQIEEIIFMLDEKQNKE
jgi:hypothetical protein